MCIERCAIWTQEHRRLSILRVPARTRSISSYRNMGRGCNLLVHLCFRDLETGVCWSILLFIHPFKICTAKGRENVMKWGDNQIICHILVEYMINYKWKRVKAGVAAVTLFILDVRAIKHLAFGSIFFLSSTCHAPLMFVFHDDGDIAA